MSGHVGQTTGTCHRSVVYYVNSAHNVCICAWYMHCNMYYYLHTCTCTLYTHTLLYALWCKTFNCFEQSYAFLDRSMARLIVQECSTVHEYYMLHIHVHTCA